MHRKLSLIIAVACCLFGFSSPAFSKPIRVLIVDGFSNHDWQLTTALIRGFLEPTGQFEIDVSTAPANADAPGWDDWRPSFSDYDIVIQTCNDINGGPPWPMEVRIAFEKYVKSGGGVYVWHSGNNAFADWPEYNQMIGLGWRSKDYGWAISVDENEQLVRIPPGEGGNTSHGSRLDTVVKRFGDHPIHAGLPRAWKTPDIEVYYFARGPAENIEVLSYGYEPNTEQNWPLEWTVGYGRGRVYTSTFGHVWKGDVQPERMRCAGLQTVVVRALHWLAGRDVPTNVPMDFPTASEMSVREEIDIIDYLADSKILLPNVESKANAIPISEDAFAGSSINVVAGQQSNLFTDTNIRMQFTAFYSGDGTLTFGRRALGENEWTLKRTEYRGNVDDAHNTAAIAVDGDGFLHVAWDHHGHPLNYARGTEPGSIDIGEKQPMTGSNESKVTYPQFLRLPDGDLLFFYRDGQSGRGSLVLNRYETKKQKWTQLHTNLIDGEGQRSAYTSMSVDGKGALHLAWNWRDTPDVASNHDLCYARSEDGGETWNDSAGHQLTVPFTLANAEYALHLPAGSSLMNPPSVTADSQGWPIIANYWCPEGSDIRQYHIVHYDGKVWRTQQVTRRSNPFVLAGRNTKRPPISRSALLSSKSDSGKLGLHLVYRDDERGGRIALVSSTDLYAQKPLWSIQDLTLSSVGAWEPSLDPIQASDFEELQMLVQSVDQRDGNDEAASSVDPTPISLLRWKP